MNELEYKFLTIGSFILSCSLFYSNSVDLKKISKAHLGKISSKRTIQEINKAIKKILDLLNGSIYRITFDKILDLKEEVYQNIYKF